MTSLSKTPDRALMIVGASSLVFALLGFWYNSTTLFLDFTPLLAELNKEGDFSNFYNVFYLMSGICLGFYIALFASGVQLLRKNAAWVVVLLCVIGLEAIYFLLLGLLWSRSTQAHTIAAASGVSSGGLMVQVFTLFPIWAPIVAIWAKRRKMSNAN